jgi:5-methylthioadenosine/S-adenosylhomocysteine deaminase
LLFKNIAVLNEDFSVSFGMDVQIEGAFIKSITPTDELSHCVTRDDVINGDGKLLTPAFYNAHGHAPMTLLRGYGENMKLHDWLEKKIFPFEDKLTGEDCYHATMLALAESFANGIVSTAENYFFCDDMVRAAVESQSKVNISRGLSFFDEILDLAGFKAFQESKKLFSDHHGTYDDRIRVDIGMHAEFTATPGLIEAVAGLSHETGAPVHVHVSETRSEHEECKERYGGRTPVQVFTDNGVFDNGGIAAHCVWIEEEDADILKGKNVSVATCPVSNMKLASGIARIPLLLEKGVNVALGTDGPASNNSLNFFESMKLLSLSAKVRFGDPTLISPAEALYSATRAGAIAQGRPDCGYVKEGFRADLIMLDLGSPSMNPVCEMANALVFAASNRDILMTLSDGRVVYENGIFPTIDLEKTIFEVERSKTRILEELAAESS